MPICQIGTPINCIRKTCYLERRMSAYAGRARTALRHFNARYSIYLRNYARLSKAQNVIQHEP